MGVALGVLFAGAMAIVIALDGEPRCDGIRDCLQGALPAFAVLLILGVLPTVVLTALLYGLAAWVGRAIRGRRS